MNNAKEPKTFRADNGNAGWKVLSSGELIRFADNGDFTIPAIGYMVLKEWSQWPGLNHCPQVPCMDVLIQSP
jgi:hypothetical protein